MSLQVRLNEQVLCLKGGDDALDAAVHKYDGFLNLLSAPQYAFQRDAIRTALRFQLAGQYPDLERLARENFSDRAPIRSAHDNVDAYLSKMPLRGLKAASLDLATGTGKSFVMYGLAAIILAEGIADRVLVLCPSLTIEDGLLEKFRTLAGNTQLAAILTELGSTHPIPGIRRGSDTIHAGDICIENIHAAYQNAGTSIAVSFKGHGGRTLVLNDEAHHLFSPPESSFKEWLKFLLNPDYGFARVVNVTGTPYTDNDYFPDVIYRYGIKQAIEDRVVKKPDYKVEDTYKAHDWAKTYEFHRRNQQLYGAKVKPISIIVTQEIAGCVEVWRELVEYLAQREGTTVEEAAKKAIWVASGIPSNAAEKERVKAAFGVGDHDDSPEKRRRANLRLLKIVDERDCPVEWIVSVSMLTEGWDVKNVFQIVPHESRAFSSKLLIQQVLGRGLRVPPGFTTQPLVTINNHEKWSTGIAELLREVLEVENTLWAGYDAGRSQFGFPIFNLTYELKQTTVQVRRNAAREPGVSFVPQEPRSVEYSKLSESGLVPVEIEHLDNYEIDDVVRFMRLYMREKDEKIAEKWPKKRLRDFIVAKLEEAGQDTRFISKANLLRLQQGFGPMFGQLGQEHPRLGRVAAGLVPVDVANVPSQYFSESALREHGHVYYAENGDPPFTGQEAQLWNLYERLRKQYDDAPDIASDDAKAIAPRFTVVDTKKFKMPRNVHYAAYRPERRFSDLLFENADSFAAFVKMPDRGGYSFPYSYKPAKAGRTHTLNENCNPDYFLRAEGKNDILVVEIKSDDDDSNRNRAKCRDGLKHFETLNERLATAKEVWRYHFYFLSPEDYTKFFERIRQGTYQGWRSSLMQSLLSADVERMTR